MFDKQYRFKGRHALRVDQLTGVFDELSKAKLIDRNVDVYANAPLIGFLYGRTADLDDLKNPETHPFTIARKGSTNPLVDSGNLVDSIKHSIE